MRKRKRKVHRVPDRFPWQHSLFYYDRLEFSWHNHLSRIKQVLSRPRHGYTVVSSVRSWIVQGLQSIRSKSRLSRFEHFVRRFLPCPTIRCTARPKYNLFNKQNGGKPYRDLTAKINDCLCNERVNRRVTLSFRSRFREIEISK